MHKALSFECAPRLWYIGKCLKKSHARPKMGLFIHELGSKGTNALFFELAFGVFLTFTAWLKKMII